MKMDAFELMETLSSLCESLPMDVTCKFSIKSGFYWVEIEKVDGEVIYLPIEAVNDLAQAFKDHEEMVNADQNVA